MLKRLFESCLLLSRWLLAPFFVMLTLGLLALLAKAGKQLFGAYQSIAHGHEEHVTLALLSLVDITLTGALVVIVTISLYENFISPIRSDEASGPEWMRHVDFAQIKFKLLTTIVAISAIKLLEVFMDVPEVNDREIYRYVLVHWTFVGSIIAFAVADRLSERDNGRPPPPAD